VIINWQQHYTKTEMQVKFHVIKDSKPSKITSQHQPSKYMLQRYTTTDSITKQDPWWYGHKTHGPPGGYVSYAAASAMLIH